MTTFTLTGFAVDYDIIGDPVAVVPITLEAVFPDGQGFLNYTILQSFPDELP